MNSKVLLLSVAVIAIGLFAMPSTLSLFAGQHTFYSGSEVDCGKCHQDIETEITMSPTAHTTAELQLCEGCHKTNTTALNELIPYDGQNNATDSATNFTGINITTNAQAHAAVTMECIGCHGGVDEELTGTDAAHTAFYYGANYSEVGNGGNQSAVNLKGSNTACVGCHTHAIINVTWVRAAGYNLQSNATGAGWELAFSMNYSANVTNYSAGE